MGKISEGNSKWLHSKLGIRLALNLQDQDITSTTQPCDSTQYIPRDARDAEDT